FSKRL
ncbi:unnamed protein product, partial [Allacma fusca]